MLERVKKCAGRNLEKEVEIQMAYITCKDLTLGYEGHAIVSDLNFKVSKGDYLCIVGENGTGKSTLIKTLLHLQDAISGDSILKIEMQFLPDVYVPCEVCHGKRYNRETLEVKYKGKNIFEVLDMNVDEACEFFESVPSIRRKIETLRDVGLSYIKLGQPSTTLSGGEAQRVKLATELSRQSTGKTIYVLDEPTTGLHFADVHKLVDILQRLTEGGNTVVVIEHNLEVIKTADYIIDMGPEGGEGGGTMVTCGTPEEVAAVEESYTGKYLKRYLNPELPQAK